MHQIAFPGFVVSRFESLEFSTRCSFVLFGSKFTRVEKFLIKWTVHRQKVFHKDFGFFVTKLFLIWFLTFSTFASEFFMCNQSCTLFRCFCRSFLHNLFYYLKLHSIWLLLCFSEKIMFSIIISICCWI